MITTGELYSYFDRKIPRALSCDWDNDGLMVCADSTREVKKALFALDVTDAVADYAIAGGYDLIISHHPLIFSPLKAINTENPVCARALRLIAAGISVFSFHTRLDALDGGVNDILAASLGLENTRPFGPAGEEMGRIGELACEMTAESFTALVKERVSSHITGHFTEREIRTVAVLGGSGRDFIDAAKAAGAEVFLCGEAGYHAVLDAPSLGIGVVEAGHYETENGVSAFFADAFRSDYPEIVFEIYPREGEFVH